MRKLFLTLLLASMAAQQVQAGDGKCSGPLCNGKGECAIQAALKKLPTLAYVVGDKSTCCSKQAAAMVRAQKADLRFAAQRTFDSEAEAMQFFTSLTSIKDGRTSEKGDSRQDKECKDGECPTEAAQTLPTLLYQVGAKTTNCSMSAADLSKANDATVQFVVRQVYPTRAAATLALAERTEAIVDQFCSSVGCELSGKFTVGGRSLDCAKDAAATAARLRQAIDLVSVSYKVGDKECDCPGEARACAAKANATVVFAVDGKETTCPIQHRLNTARAKYRAAVETVARAER